MMAGLFIIAAAALTAILLDRRGWAFALLALGLVLSTLMFLHHATDTLQINW